MMGVNGYYSRDNFLKQEMSEINAFLPFFKILFQWKNTFAHFDPPKSQQYGKILSKNVAKAKFRKILVDISELVKCTTS